jgi:Xaa-Pro aminopeptidase
MIHVFLGYRFKFLLTFYRKNGFTALVLKDQSLVRFFTDFYSSNAYLIVYNEEIILVTDRRYELVLEEIDGRIVKKTAKSLNTEIIDNILPKELTKIGCDSTLLSDSLGKSLADKSKEFVDVTLDLEKFISLADNETMRRFYHANLVTQKIEGKLKSILKNAIKEYQVRAEISYLIHFAGCEEAFTPIVSFGENSAKIHSEPTDKNLTPESAVLIDFGVKYKGVSTDITRSYWFGKNPTAEYLKAYKTVKQALKRCQEFVMPDASCAAADEKAFTELSVKHLVTDECMPHSLGHGLGYEVHQHPRISRYSNDKFEEGQIITLEPGIYIPGKFGIRIENDYLVTSIGPRKLTI